MINSSQTNGAYINADNVKINSISILKYGGGNPTKKVVNVPYYGFKLFRSSNISINKLEVTCQKDENIPKDNLEIWDCENLMIKNIISTVQE